MIRLVATSIFLLSMPMLIGCDHLANSDLDVDTAERLYKQRKFAEAIPHLQNALEKPQGADTRSEVLTTIGNCYKELGELEKSMEYHSRAIEEDPKNHYAYVNKGIVCRLMGDFDEAAKLYSKALELAPDYAELHASMGALAIHQGDYNKAIEHLERAVDLDDKLPVIHSNLAIAYASAGQFGKAEKELKKAIVRGYHQAEAIRERIEQLRKLANDGT